MFMRLAGHLGKTQAELEATLTRDDLLEWIAFFELEPFGSKVSDQHFETLCQLIFAANRSKDQDIPNFFNRDPKPEVEVSLADKIDDFFDGLPHTEE